ncbi:hypothetical protein ABFS83_12G042100 [Erythranthe nasuta]
MVLNSPASPLVMSYHYSIILLAFPSSIVNDGAHFGRPRLGPRKWARKGNTSCAGGVCTNWWPKLGLSSYNKVRTAWEDSKKKERRYLIQGKEVKSNKLRRKRVI